MQVARKHGQQISSGILFEYVIEFVYMGTIFIDRIVSTMEREVLDKMLRNKTLSVKLS